MININMNKIVDYIKYSIYVLIGVYIISSNSNAQIAYQKYDTVVRGMEYNITKAQYEANRAIIENYQTQKSMYSNFSKEGSVLRSRAQGIIGAKENENHRLKVKMIILKKSGQIQEVE